MPKPHDEKLDPGLPDLSMQESDSADDDEAMPPAHQSEVATRLHLLGKLIIPRSAP